MRGKATGSSCVKLNSQDHPRVCGEKPERKAPRRPRLGSPPRMRGKVGHCLSVDSRSGITPAYAGKRPKQAVGSFQPRDHPRVCGEKPMSCRRTWAATGSPPRMRGKETREGAFFDAAGITPAYAGKSVIFGVPRTDFGDHPRVCGEKTLSVMGRIVLEGSPPRMRGKDVFFPILALQVGITPAYAGKRAESTNQHQSG